MSASKACFNTKCGAASTKKWRAGWILRSGEFADLCDSCGFVYEQMRFCETFHSDDAGWRICSTCQKPVHCGCIASVYSFTHLDAGGIECINCSRKSDSHTSASNQIQQMVPILSLSQKFVSRPIKNCSEHIGGIAVPGQWLQVPISGESLTSQIEVTPAIETPEVQRSDAIDPPVEKHDNGRFSFFGLKLTDGDIPKKNQIGEAKVEIPEGFSKRSSVHEERENAEDFSLDRRETCLRTFTEEGFTKRLPDSELQIREMGTNKIEQDEHYEPDIFKISKEKVCTLEAPASACLNVSPRPFNPKETSDNSSTPITGVGLYPCSPMEIKERNQGLSTCSQLQQQCQLMPRPPDGSPNTDSLSANGVHCQIRVAQIPGEGRSQNQLQPRYRPRITDQELQKICGDANSTVKPLFEKTLSASDAGRIGRLVLPKACAEAYFPSISQPEGVPLKFQDANGKDWVFQFRFWPNNNSRMYVLEGVTTYIQSMQLQAGDTVTFSRLDPEGQIIMGFRKASNSTSRQEAQLSTTGNEASPNMGCDPGIIENMSADSDISEIPLHSRKRNRKSLVKALTSQLSNAGFSLYRKEYKSKESSSFHSLMFRNKMQNHNLGSKRKRLQIDNEDALDLKVTWEEAQDFLCPPLTAVPSVVIIEGHEFEEYEEPPIFGKRTTFTTNQSRASCSVPHEGSSDDLEYLPQHSTDPRKKKSGKGQKGVDASAGLDALANAATLGEKTTTSSSIAATTKHPRHRPGCTCIVCIQPPSGKGPKHKPTCICNVCTTVKRRFKTLMMRRKERQSEIEAENTRKKLNFVEEEGDVISGKKRLSDIDSHNENGLTKEDPDLTFKKRLTKVGNSLGNELKLASDVNLQAFCKGNKGGKEEYIVSKGQLDLNNQPDREEEPDQPDCDEEPSPDIGQTSMASLRHDATLPLHMYLKQHGLPTLTYPPRINSTLQLQQTSGEGRVEEQTSVQNEDHMKEEEFFPIRTQNDAQSIFV